MSPSLINVPTAVLAGCARFQFILLLGRLLLWVCWFGLLISKVDTTPMQCAPSPINTLSIKAIGALDQKLFVVYDKHKAWNSTLHLSANDANAAATGTETTERSKTDTAVQNLQIAQYNLKKTLPKKNRKKREETETVLNFDLNHPIDERRFLDQYPKLVPIFGDDKLIDSIVFLDNERLMIKAHSILSKKHSLILVTNGTIQLEQEVNSMLNNYHILYDYNSNSNKKNINNNNQHIQHNQEQQLITINNNNNMPKVDGANNMKQYPINMISIDQFIYYDGHFVLPPVSSSDSNPIEIHTSNQYRYLAFSRTLNRTYLAPDVATLSQMKDYLPGNTLLPDSVQWNTFSYSGNIFLIVSNELVLYFPHRSIAQYEQLYSKNGSNYDQEVLVIETGKLGQRFDVWAGCRPIVGGSAVETKHGQSGSPIKLLIFMLTIALIGFVVLIVINNYKTISNKTSKFIRFYLQKPNNKSCSIKSCPSTITKKTNSLRYDQRWKSVGSQVDYKTRVCRIRGIRERRRSRRSRTQADIKSLSGSGSSSDSVTDRNYLGITQQTIENQNKILMMRKLSSLERFAKKIVSGLKTQDSSDIQTTPKTLKIKNNQNELNKH